MLHWLKTIFKPEPFVNKGSSHEIYQMYLSCKIILDGERIHRDDFSKALEIMRDMTTIMHTVGDGRLVTELQEKMREVMDSEVINYENANTEREHNA